MNTPLVLSNHLYRLNLVYVGNEKKEQCTVLLKNFNKNRIQFFYQHRFIWGSLNETVTFRDGISTVVSFARRMEGGYLYSRLTLSKSLLYGLLTRTPLLSRETFLVKSRRYKTGS